MIDEIHIKLLELGHFVEFEQVWSGLRSDKLTVNGTSIHTT